LSMDLTKIEKVKLETTEEIMGRKEEMKNA
jgi:hypothetical protein